MLTPKLQAIQPGERTSPEGKPVSNKLLLALSDEEFRLVRPCLTFVTFSHQESFHQPHRLVKFAYFSNEA
jgi:hypothetical protein